MFLRFMQHHSSVMRQFIRLLMNRLAQRPTDRRARLSTIALGPAGRRRNVDDFARALVQGFGGDIAPEVLDVASINARLPGMLAAATDAQIAHQLNDLELEHGLLLYVCDSANERWSTLCLRQADRVLLIGDADDDPSPNAVESLLFARAGVETLRGCELVLLHSAGTKMPRDSGRWVGGRNLRCHHHLRAGDAGGMRRIARHLLGRSVGLVLGGGGAKALAEIGVLRALEETGVPVDVIGGTSMGAVIGALAAQGYDAQAVHAAMREALRLKPFSGIILPVVSLLSGKRLARTMRFLFGDLRIEDLWRRYFCVSCNLTHGRVEVHDSGELAKWVMASNAIPGIVPPVLKDGELFVDGGLLNNLPADVMRTRSQGTVIAVNVSSVAELRAGVADDADFSGWRAILDGLRPQDASKAVPRLDRILMRSMLLASANHSQSMRAHTAHYLTPPVTNVDLNDWHALDRLVDSGYQYTMGALEKWDRGQINP
jgi:predicted acylesterase/phospholipase RssA